MDRSITARRVATLVGDFDRTPAYAGLADALVLLIGDGRIPAGTRLPSERELTDALGVSRTTVTRAYATVRDSGYAAARQGSGTFTQVPGGPVALPGEQGPVVGARRPARHLGVGARALPRLGVAGVADGRVGASDGGAGDPELLGQLALAGQPGTGRDPAVADQQHQGVGEPGVGRSAVEPADQGGHAARGDGAVHAGHSRTIGHFIKGHLASRW